MPEEILMVIHRLISFLPPDHQGRSPGRLDRLRLPLYGE
jgi:hypothetical protein